MTDHKDSFTAKQWVETWKKAGPELERIRNVELRNLDEAEGTRIATFLGVAKELLKRRGSSIGELHRLLRKSVSRSNV